MAQWEVTDKRKPLYDWRRIFHVEANNENEAYRAGMAKAETGPFDLQVREAPTPLVDIE